MEKLLNISSDIVQEEHKYESLKCEPNNSKFSACFWILQKT